MGFNIADLCSSGQSEERQNSCSRDSSDKVPLSMEDISPCSIVLVSKCISIYRSIGSSVHFFPQVLYAYLIQHAFHFRVKHLPRRCGAIMPSEKTFSSPSELQLSYSLQNSYFQYITTLWWCIKLWHKIVLPYQSTTSSSFSRMQ